MYEIPVPNASSSTFQGKHRQLKQSASDIACVGQLERAVVLRSLELQLHEWSAPPRDRDALQGRVEPWPLLSEQLQESVLVADHMLCGGVEVRAEDVILWQGGQRAGYVLACLHLPDTRRLAVLVRPAARADSVAGVAEWSLQTLQEVLLLPADLQLPLCWQRDRGDVFTVQWRC